MARNIPSDILIEADLRGHSKLVEVDRGDVAQARWGCDECGLIVALVDGSYHGRALERQCGAIDRVRDQPTEE